VSRLILNKKEEIRLQILAGVLENVCGKYWGVAGFQLSQIPE
jgi:hypothetical protein